MKAAIYPNFQKNNALECARKLCDILKENDFEIFIDESFKNEFHDKSMVKYGAFEKIAKSSDFVIAIGGDGTILRCAKNIIDFDTKLLGINTGRLGFMSALEYDQLGLISKLKDGNYTVSERMLLKAQIKNGNLVTTAEALNDISLSSAYSNICEFNICVDGGFIGKYRADGVVFSTPTGSTAYSLSAGGPIIEPEMKCIEMTLICPHSLFSRTTLFSAGRRLRLTPKTSGNDCMVINVDGGLHINLYENESIEIKRGRHVIKFIDLIGNSFHESLCRKLCRPIK